MKRNFGFEPYEGRGKYGFVSYKSEEYDTVAKYAKALNDRGIKLWYDYGIPEGEWEDAISEKIVGASFIILFVSAKIFDSHFIKTEIKTAWKWRIPIIPVFMEKIRTSQVAPKNATFFTRIESLQGVSEIEKMSVEQVADELEKLVKPKIASDKDSAINTRRATYERERRERPRPSSAPENEAPIEAPLQTEAHTHQQFKIKPIAITVAIILALGIVIALVVKGFGNQIEDNYINNTSSDDTSSGITIEIGQHLTFGTYEQDGDASNGAEPIEWRVLAVKDGKALLIADKLLDYVTYNQEYTKSVTWETCTLRKWMNEDFINEAFTESEQGKIALTTLSNPDTPGYGTEGGNDTQDKIFALSIEEAEKYFSSNDDRKAYVTDYANKYSSGLNYWALRSPGRGSDSASNVDINGCIDTYGILVNRKYISVRPAMWIEI